MVSPWARDEGQSDRDPTPVATGSTSASGSAVAGGAPVAVSLYARGNTDARVREDAVFARLRELQRAGRIGELHVRTWPGEVSIDREGQSEVVDTFRGFEEWAREHGASVRPPFAIRERTSTLTEQTDTLLVTPLVCLALYAEGDLVGVYPCNREGTVTTIDDCLERLAAEDDLGFPDEPQTVPGSRSTPRRPGDDGR